ncbi:MAG: nucleotidyltransferase domain-containing protein [Planctomycetota bacterium]|nr:nucleotidyltransferase domain-containing protein [Planctomycetota bacterium]
MDSIGAFCRRWRVRELCLFGSVLREDFGPDSDIDMLVTFQDGADWSMWDQIRMEEEMAALLGRRTDLVSRKAVEESENYIRRRHILSTAQRIYAA